MRERKQWLAVHSLQEENCVYSWLLSYWKIHSTIFTVFVVARLNMSSDHLFLLVAFDIKVFIFSGKEYVISEILRYKDLHCFHTVRDSQLQLCFHLVLGQCWLWLLTNIQLIAAASWIAGSLALLSMWLKVQPYFPVELPDTE